MSSATFYNYPESFRGYKVLIAAKYSGFSLSEVIADGSTKNESFVEKFPLGRIPALETSQGVKLNDSNAIAYYVSNNAMRGEKAEDAAAVLQWMNFAENEVAPAASTWVFPCMGILQFNKQNTERAKEEVKAILTVLNNHLRTRTFLVGEAVTLADIAMATHLVPLYKMVLEPSFRGPFKNTNRWFETVCNQPQFKAVVEVSLCTKAAQFDSKKYAEVMGKKEGGKKESKQAAKKDTPKKVAPKEEAKPAQAAAPAKPKDPFLSLPAGSFVVDEWKRTKENEDFDTVALPYLLEKFDTENYSIWFSEYEYNAKLKQAWMTANLVKGMFQRLDGLRKYGYGVVGIFGEDNALTISGLWLWRGQGLAFDLSEDLNIDAPSYKWTKLDFKAPETLEKIKSYFGNQFPESAKLAEISAFL